MATTGPRSRPKSGVRPRRCGRNWTAPWTGSRVTSGWRTPPMPESHARLDSGELCAELRRRWKAGERTPVEEFLRRFPDLNSDPDGLLDLIYSEVVLREESGERPLADEYVARFPSFAEQIRDQFEVHRAIA